MTLDPAALDALERGLKEKCLYTDGPCAACNLERREAAAAITDLRAERDEWERFCRDEMDRRQKLGAEALHLKSRLAAAEPGHSGVISGPMRDPGCRLEMQKHRDRWREYAYGNRDKPTDFLDGNKVDRGPTAIDALESRLDAITELAERGGLPQSAGKRFDTIRAILALAKGENTAVEAVHHAREQLKSRLAAAEAAVVEALEEACCASQWCAGSHNHQPDIEKGVAAGLKRYRAALAAHKGGTG